MTAPKYIIDDNERQLFKVNRRVFMEPHLLEEEHEKIFNKCWIYIGHESEVEKPGDFQTRHVAGRPLIFSKNSDGVVQAFFNACPHRGATVCREHSGNTKVFRCFYHAWTFHNNGELMNLPGEESYGPLFDRNKMHLRHVPRLESYKGFYFVNYDVNAVSLYDYLADAKEYLDLIVEQSPSGRMEIVQGTQEYDMRANWKLLVENSFDDYHVAPTHATYLDYLRDSGVSIAKPKGLMLPAHGIGKALGNGHAVIDNETYRGRPVANWMPMYGEEVKAEQEKLEQELNSRLGPERARRVAKTNRNLVIFPNLVINDGSSITVRTFFPSAYDHMRVTAWCLGAKEDTEVIRAVRLDSFLTFYGPGGFATPDDTEALEVAQEGYKTYREFEWNEMSRGMNKTGEQLNTDEIHMRTFWRRWNEIMTGEPVKGDAR